jgi:hypothetical protein
VEGELEDGQVVAVEEEVDDECVGLGERAGGEGVGEAVAHGFGGVPGGVFEWGGVGLGLELAEVGGGGEGENGDGDGHGTSGGGG